MTKNLLNFAVAGVMCLFVACSNEAKDQKTDPIEHAEEMNEEKFEDDKEDDAERLVKLYCDNIYEIRAAEQAALRANTVDVKKLAGMIVVAHNKMKKDLQELAGKKNITLPPDMTEEQRRDLEKMGEKTGFNYDKDFAQQMKKKHEEAINDLERTMNKTEDPEIRQLASTYLPEVKTHLEMTEATINAVKDLKEEDREKKKVKNTWEGKSDLHDGRDEIHDDKK